MKQWYKMAAKDKKAEILLYNEIGAFGVTAKDFRDDLKDLGDVGEINLRINSAGGSVIDGFAIYNTLQAHPASIRVDIDGWAASMASIIAMAGDEVIMPRNAWMVIHNPWTLAVGDSEDLRKSANILDAMKTSAIEAYQAHAKDLSEEEISKHMDDETWMNGSDAVALGYADTVAEPLDVAASIDLKDGSFLNVPEDAMEWVAKNAVDDGGEDVPAEDDKPDDPEDSATEKTPDESGDKADTSTDEDAVKEQDDSSKGLKSQVYKNGVAVGKAEQLIEQNKVVRDLEDKIKKLEVALDDEKCLAFECQERLNRLLPGMSASEMEDIPVSWKEAMAKCEGDYAEARKKYPQVYKAQREIDRKNRIS